MKKQERERIAREVEHYFDGTEHEVEVRDMGDCVVVEGSYQDFRQTRQVRLDLLDIDPCIVVGTLDRYYSPTAMKNAFGLIASEWLEARGISQGIPDFR